MLTSAYKKTSSPQLSICIEFPTSNSDDAFIKGILCTQNDHIVYEYPTVKNFHLITKQSHIKKDDIKTFSCFFFCVRSVVSQPLGKDVPTQTSQPQTSR